MKKNFKKATKITITISTGITDRSKWEELREHAKAVRNYLYFIGCGAPSFKGSIIPGVFVVTLYPNNVALADIKDAVEDAFGGDTVFLPEKEETSKVKEDN